MNRSAPVFHDPSGRRWRRLRTGALVVGILTTAMLLVLAGTLLVPPLLPSLDLGRPTTDPVPDRRARVAPTRTLSPRREREQRLARQRLFEQLRRHPAVPSKRYVEMPVGRRGPRADSALAARPADDPIVAGFYVNWDDNSLVSLRQHLDRLDWIVAEWGFLGLPTDSAGPIAFRIDRRVLATVAQAAEAPQILLMITNASGGEFDPARLRPLLTQPAVRARVIDSIAAILARENLAGVTLDFERVPSRLQPALLAFVRQLKARLSAAGRLVTQAIPAGDPSWPIEAYARIVDRVFLMLYDENDGSGDPGPIASRDWFRYELARTVARIPPGKIILGIGQYGYRWDENQPVADQLDFQETVQAARDHDLLPALDSVAGNEYFAWTDADSTDHIVWYLDAVTAYNEIRTATNFGVGGLAVWRLGSEDPSLWSVLGRQGLTRAPDSLAVIRVSYDVDFQGVGEILDLAATPTVGSRTITVDPKTGLIGRSQVRTLPSTYVLRRYGHRPHQVALTFDDGPDGRYTGPILDTLRSRGVPATFFIIGINAESHPELIRREFREGHEIGNHTFTHPNLALASRLTTRLELTATGRLLEALIDRRTTLFRAPYFGDAEPTTADELIPITEAKELGYITVGLHVDPGDWETPGADTIVRRALDQLDRGNVVLLHDGGGVRSQTVAALGTLIDSVRARGDSFVTVSALAGLTRDQVMLPLPPGGRLQRFVELGSFSLFGGIDLALRLVFLVAVVLGLGRLAFLVALAAVQRYRRPRRAVGSVPTSVSVIIPAFREEKVIVRTVQSILDQQQPGLEILVVDDGSPDQTFDTAREAFAHRPEVRVFRKPNGGKASALNYGLARATGEVVVALDADTLFAPHTIGALLEPLADPKVGAVAGNAKVGNRINLVTRWQAIEYITSQNVDRRAFSLLNCITVVPGAVGAWRRELVVAVGGFSDDTLAEDQDLTLSLLERGWRIAYADRAVAYTEAPDTLRTLSRQRFRWSFGTLQCAWKHRRTLLRPRFGTLGMVALPNVWIFQLLFPFISPVADLLFLWSLVAVYLNAVQHSAEYALQSLEQVVFFYTAFLLIDWLAAVIALVMEPGEERWLSWLVLLQRFAYRQVMYWVVVRSAIAALQGRVVGWGKLERKSTVADIGADRPGPAVSPLDS